MPPTSAPAATQPFTQDSKRLAPVTPDRSDLPDAARETVLSAILGEAPVRREAPQAPPPPSAPASPKARC